MLNRKKAVSISVATIRLPSTDLGCIDAVPVNVPRWLLKKIIKDAGLA